MNTDLSTPLTKGERAALDKCEDIIERGKKTFVSVGLALSEIRDKRLYRQKYSSFRIYCEQRWGFSETYGTRLIQAAEVVKALPIGKGPVTESQARELVDVAPAKRVEVLKQATAAAESKGRPVTAADIRAAAAPAIGRKTTLTVRETWHTSSDNKDDFALAMAARVIAILNSIPKNAPHRAEALEKIAAWIKENA